MLHFASIPLAPAVAHVNELAASRRVVATQSALTMVTDEFETPAPLARPRSRSLPRGCASVALDSDPMPTTAVPHQGSVSVTSAPTASGDEDGVGDGTRGEVEDVTLGEICAELETVIVALGVGCADANASRVKSGKGEDDGVALRLSVTDESGDAECVTEGKLLPDVEADPHALGCFEADTLVDKVAVKVDDSVVVGDGRADSVAAAAPESDGRAETELTSEKDAIDADARALPESEKVAVARSVTVLDAAALALSLASTVAVADCDAVASPDERVVGDTVYVSITLTLMLGIALAVRD